MIKIALPKGRMGEKIYEKFVAAGYNCPDLFEDNRRLVFESKDKRVGFVLVKPSDVTVYVERGAADIGVVGKDVLVENAPDVYEILDLGVGRCRIAVACKNDWREDASRPLRVATKYPRIAKAYYDSLARQIDIIELHGSIELAPLLGMSDVIVDIVETGATLKENDLRIAEIIGESSARLIANKSAYNLSGGAIRALAAQLEAL